jgi:hypothetical protein
MGIKITRIGVKLILADGDGGLIVAAPVFHKGIRIPDLGKNGRRVKQE